MTINGERIVHTKIARVTEGTKKTFSAGGKWLGKLGNKLTNRDIANTVSCFEAQMELVYTSMVLRVRALESRVTTMASGYATVLRVGTLEGRVSAAEYMREGLRGREKQSGSLRLCLFYPRLLSGSVCRL